MNVGYIGAIDQGTTGTRFMVFDRDGIPVHESYSRHEQIYPRQGWVEHDPVEIWRNTRSAVRETPDRFLSEVVALGITNQRETTVLWNGSGEPVYNAVVWQDSRTTDRIDELNDEVGGEIRQKTGLTPNSYFSATKLEWILEEVNAEDVEDLFFGTMDSWLMYRLTEGEQHVTDVTNASRTMLYSIDDMEWSEYLLGVFEIPREVLPEVHPSYGVIHGYTDVGGVLESNVPVTSILGDQQASLFGHCCFSRGEAKNTYGTGSFLLANTGTERSRASQRLLETVAYQKEGGSPRYALEAPVFMTGGVVEWLMDIGLIESPGETEEMARDVDTGKLFLVPAFTGLGAPYWDEKAAGTLIGLTRDSGPRQITRAALESIGYQTLDATEAIRNETGLSIDSLKVDGGVAGNDLVCEIQAGMLSADIVRPESQEITALGAGYAAGITVDFWSDRKELSKIWNKGSVFQKNGYGHPVNHEGWKEAVSRVKDWG